MTRIKFESPSEAWEYLIGDISPFRFLKKWGNVPKEAVEKYFQFLKSEPNYYEIWIRGISQESRNQLIDHIENNCGGFI